VDPEDEKTTINDDEGTSGEDEPIEDAKPDKKTKAPKMAPAMTQDDFDKIVKKEKAKAKRSALEDAGITGDWEEKLLELQALQEEKEKREEEEAKRREEEQIKRGDFDVLIAKKDAALTAEREEKERIKNELTNRYNSRIINEKLSDAFLSNNGLPKALRSFLRDVTGEVTFAVTEDEDIEVLNAKGKRVTDSDGNYVTLEGAVKEHLRANPFLVKGSGTRGAGSEPGISSDGVPLDDNEKMKEFNRLVDEEKVPTDEAWRRVGMPTT